MGDRSPAERLVKDLQLAAKGDTFTEQDRVGIRVQSRLGVSLYEIRRICKGIHDHETAIQLWKTGIHEARIMACLVDIPAEVNAEQMNEWVDAFDSWDLCDQATTSLFDQTQEAPGLVFGWAKDEKEFTRRAAFSTIAGLAVHNHSLSDPDFESYFPLIWEYCTDPRNYVKKGISWALRNTAKRNAYLFDRCVSLSEELVKSEDRAARWIGLDANREFQKRIQRGR